MAQLGLQRSCSSSARCPYPRTGHLIRKLHRPSHPSHTACHVIQKDEVAEAILNGPGLGNAADPTGADITELAKQVLESDPEMQEQLQRYQQAMARVDRAKAAAQQVEIEYAEAALGASKSEAEEDAARRQKASEIMADAEVAAAEKLLMAAELRNALAQQERARLSAEAGQDAGRIESGKAATAAVLGGTVGLLPFLVLGGEQAQQGLPAVLSLLAAAASCALFGVTYRYAVGSNPQNPHLRGGGVAAFGLVRAAAAADVLQASSAQGPFAVEVIGTAALYAGQSMLMFAFAAAAIEAAFQQGFIKRIDDSPASS